MRAVATQSSDATALQPSSILIGRKDMELHYMQALNEVSGILPHDLVSFSGSNVHEVHTFFNINPQRLAYNKFLCFVCRYSEILSRTRFRYALHTRHKRTCKGLIWNIDTVVGDCFSMVVPEILGTTRLA